MSFCLNYKFSIYQIPDIIFYKYPIFLHSTILSFVYRNEDFKFLINCSNTYTVKSCKRFMVIKNII